MRAHRSRFTVGMVLGLLVGTAIPAAAQEESSSPQPPTELTGVWCIGPAVAPGAWRNAVAMSDSRFQGDAYQTYESHTYGGSGIEVIASTLSIVNEAGAWVSRRYHSSGALADPTDTGNVFVGEGAYEGLIAFMSDDGAAVPRPEEIPAEYEGCAEVEGAIIEGALAEPYMPE